MIMVWIPVLHYNLGGSPAATQKQQQQQPSRQASVASSHLCTGVRPLPDRFMDAGRHRSHKELHLGATRSSAKSHAARKSSRLFSKASGSVLHRKCSIHTAVSEHVKETQRRLMWRVLMRRFYTELLPLGVF